MKKSNTIVLAEDISLNRSHIKRAEAVKSHVVAFAERFGSSIDLVHVDNLSQYPINNVHYKPFLDSFISNQKLRLRHLAVSSKVSIHPMFLSGSIVPTLLEFTKRKSPYEILALGTHGRRGLARVMLGSIAEEVVRNAERPVMVVGAEAQKHPSRIQSKHAHLLLATDLGPNSKKVTHQALRLAKKLKMPVTIFHSLHESFHPVIQTALTSSKGKRALKDFHLKAKSHAQKQLEQLQTQFIRSGVSCEIKLDLHSLDAGDEILKTVSNEKFALIVMGTNGRNLMAQAFLGSTARQIILDAPIPVIAVHSALKEPKSKKKIKLYSISEKEITEDLRGHRQITC